MRIHFIGIGGIGVSALAKYYLEKGHQVSGSDLVSSEITDALKKLGAKVLIGPQKISNLKTQNPKPQLNTKKFLLPELVIFSPAISSNNPELKLAKKKGIRSLSYPEALGELTKNHFTIAVSGTHGKSTTTAMIGLILIKAGFDPTVIVGTKIKKFGNLATFQTPGFGGGSNCRVGKSKYLVIEADEHFASFLNYWPKIIVLTNIEKDHLDYYKNLKNILKTYKKYISHLPPEGTLIVNKDDKNIKKIISAKKAKSSLLHSSGLFKGNIKPYFLKQKEGKKLKNILKIPGKHNIYNALAALTVARVLKIPDKISFKVLSEYRGSWRRFEETPCSIKGRKEIIKFKIISDYGHHPTEIKATLEAVREKYPKKQIWLIYQPHQYQRTYYLFKDFVKIFREARVEKLIITDIYDVAGREEKEIKKKVSSEKLIQAINKKTKHKKGAITPYFSKAEYIPVIREVKNYLMRNLNGGEVVIIMGAGDIYNLVLNLTEKGRKKK